MSTKHSRNRYAQRRYRTNNNRQQFDKRAVKQSPQEVFKITKKRYFKIIHSDCFKSYSTI